MEPAPRHTFARKSTTWWSSSPAAVALLRALDGMSFDDRAGEILGVVGESGAGKSLTGASIIGLLEPPGASASGQHLLCTANASTSCMPTTRCGTFARPPNWRYFSGPADLAQPAVHRGPADWWRPFKRICLSDHDSAAQRAIGFVARDGHRRCGRAASTITPHQFSGGMRQRVVIALALGG
jgi:peptide/nickel transport system ATP-binding protein